nr:PREDICTED: proprotein convertase subtilisin/kexin type 5-like [Apteryx mantelli mantelli]
MPPFLPNMQRERSVQLHFLRMELHFIRWNVQLRLSCKRIQSPGVTNTRDDCVLQITLPPERKSKTTLFVITCILLLLVIGAIVFIWRKSRAKTQAVNKRGYEKLTNHAKAFSSYMSNSHESTSYQEDQVIEYRDRDNEDEDDDDDDDIVYMGQDGTIYRKFKYGLLEEDEEDELEYDDESYSFR